MNLNKDTPQTKSEKAAVRALIEESLNNVSPQKSSLPVLDSWILQKVTDNLRKNKENKRKTFRVQKKPEPQLPPASRNAATTSSSLCKSSREVNTLRIPLIPLTYLSDSKNIPQFPPKPLKKSKLRSNSLADSKSKETYMEIPEIKKVLYSIILKNNLLRKLKSSTSNIPTKDFLTHHTKALKRINNLKP